MTSLMNILKKAERSKMTLEHNLKIKRINPSEKETEQLITDGWEINSFFQNMARNFEVEYVYLKEKFNNMNPRLKLKVLLEHSDPVPWGYEVN